MKQTERRHARDDGDPGCAESTRKGRKRETGHERGGGKEQSEVPAERRVLDQIYAPEEEDAADDDERRGTLVAVAEEREQRDSREDEERSVVLPERRRSRSVEKDNCHERDGRDRAVAKDVGWRARHEHEGAQGDGQDEGESPIVDRRGCAEHREHERGRDDRGGRGAAELHAAALVAQREHAGCEGQQHHLRTRGNGEPRKDAPKTCPPVDEGERRAENQRHGERVPDLRTRSRTRHSGSR